MQNLFYPSFPSVHSLGEQASQFRSVSGGIALQNRTPFVGRRSGSWAALIGLSVGLGWIPSASAAPSAPAAKTPARSSVKRVSRGEDYVLGPGDVLRVVVTGYAEFNQESVVIPPDGTVTLSNYGTLRLSGKTRLAVQRELAGLLKSKLGMRDPAVAVGITTFRPKTIGRVVLGGDVPRSGTFEIRTGYRLSDLMADTGLQSRLEERQATLVRGSNFLSLNLKAASISPRGAFDIVLRPGDSITVQQMKVGRITLAGALAKSGVYELHPVPQGEGELGLQPRLSDLITKAGGLPKGNPSVLANLGSGGNGTSKQPVASAALSSAAQSITYRATLQRSGNRSPLDPETALSQIEGPANVRLQNGDFVTIEVVPPPAPLTVFLNGSSTRTGSFSVPIGTGVYELLTTAGGITKAPGDIIASVRRGEQTLPLDLPKLLLSSESGANLTLENGDIVQLRDPETIEIQVAGRVGKPGPLQLKPGSTIRDALLAAGDLSIAPEDARLKVLRIASDGTQRVLDADAAGIIRLRDVSTNFPLQNGDQVNVAQNSVQTVTINGQVNAPNSLQMKEGEGLPELIVRAGGAKSDAALTRISVTRAGKIIQVDAYDAVREGKPLNFPIQDGDFVVVPENKNRVLVMEAVAKPGYYAIPERGTLTLLDVLAQATPQQNTKKVSVTHAKADGSIDTSSKITDYSLQDLRNGKQANVVLSPRDIVFVNSANPKRNLLGTLSSLGAIRFLFP